MNWMTSRPMRRRHLQQMYLVLHLCQSKKIIHAISIVMQLLKVLSLSMNPKLEWRLQRTPSERVNSQASIQLKIQTWSWTSTLTAQNTTIKKEKSQNRKKQTKQRLLGSKDRRQLLVSIVESPLVALAPCQMRQRNQMLKSLATKVFQSQMISIVTEKFLVSKS